MVAFQKRWPVMRGKINMICKGWCTEMGQILQFLWDIPGLSRGVPLYDNTSARRRGAILMGVVEFNHNPAKFYCPRMEREKRQNIGTSNIIGICTSHWQGGPIIDLCEILLHSELTPPPCGGSFHHHRITLSCLDQYMHRGLRLWNSQDREAV